MEAENEKGSTRRGQSCSCIGNACDIADGGRNDGNSQAEELTVDSKVAQIQGESIIPRADQVPGNEELFAQYVEQTFYGEESESYRTPAVYGNIGQNVLTERTNMYIMN